MSPSPKVAITYAKSIFQDIHLHPSNSSESSDFRVSALLENSENLNPLTPETLALELDLLSASITSSPSINKFFDDPTFSEDKKLESLLLLFPGLNIRTKALLRILTERKHLYLIPKISSEFSAFLWKTNHYLLLTLTISGVLPEKFGVSLLKQLRLLTKTKAVIMKLTYNPKILGGVIIDYNSLCLDVSILKEFSYFFSNF